MLLLDFLFRQIFLIFNKLLSLTAVIVFFVFVVANLLDRFIVCACISLPKRTFHVHYVDVLCWLTCNRYSTLARFRLPWCSGFNSLDDILNLLATLFNFLNHRSSMWLFQLLTALIETHGCAISARSQAFFRFFNLVLFLLRHHFCHFHCWHYFSFFIPPWRHFIGSWINCVEPIYKLQEHFIGLHQLDFHDLNDLVSSLSLNTKVNQISGDVTFNVFNVNRSQWKQKHNFP